MSGEEHDEWLRDSKEQALEHLVRHPKHPLPPEGIVSKPEDEVRGEAGVTGVADEDDDDDEIEDAAANPAND